MTGTTGFIGRRLLERLLADGHPCAAVLRQSSDAGKLEGKVTIIRHTGAMAELLTAVRGFSPEVLVHLAAVAGAEHKPEGVRTLIEANVLFGAEVLEAAAAAGCRGIVATGTFWEHAAGAVGYEPNSLYAATKRAFADIAEYYVRAKGVGCVTLELTDVYGPNDPRKRLIDLLRSAHRSGTPIDLSPGEQQIDLIHVDDVVAAYLAAIDDVLAAPGRTARYTVATGRLLSLRAVVSLFEKVTGTPVPVRWGARPYRPNEVMRPWIGERPPGWQPKITLEDGISQLTRQPQRST